MLSDEMEPHEDAPLPEVQPQRSSARPVVIVVAIVVGVAVFVTQILPLLIVLWPRSQKPVQRIEDMNDLRMMLGLMMVTNELPLAPDGRIDVYEVLKQHVDPKQVVDLCNSSRSGKGPTWREIEAGDYTNFPYERRKGAFDRGSPVRVPLLWDRKPSDDWSPRGSGEGRLCAFSDGSAMFEEEAVFREFLDANPGQE